MESALGSTGTADVLAVNHYTSDPLPAPAKQMAGRLPSPRGGNAAPLNGSADICYVDPSPGPHAKNETTDYTEKDLRVGAAGKKRRSSTDYHRLTQRKILGWVRRVTMTRLMGVSTPIGICVNLCNLWFLFTLRACNLFSPKE
jgi:hypothetical protein